MATPIEKPILDALKKHPHSTIRELAKETGRTADAVAVAIARMERVGLVERYGMRGWNTQKIVLVDKDRQPKPPKNWFEGWAGAPKLGL